MLVQSLPDQFYYWFYFMAALGLIAEHVTHVLSQWSKPSILTTQTQRKRYTMVWAGLLTSGFAVGGLLVQYTPAEICLGLKQLGGYMSLAFWVVLWLHVATIVVCAYFAARFYIRPTAYAYRNRYGNFVTTEQAREIRNMDRADRRPARQG